jgi:hypothetical protein
MGKSRLIDELSKAHFVIPLNLRHDESGRGYPFALSLSSRGLLIPGPWTGSPASDSHVHDWFKSQDPTPEMSDVRSSAFITALLSRRRCNPREMVQVEKYTRVCLGVKEGLNLLKL